MWYNPPVYDLSGQHLEENIDEIIPKDKFAMDMKAGANIYVAGSNYRVLSNGSLLYLGKAYSPDQFCLDYTIDYCEGTISDKMRAIIQDPELARDSASTIFGTNKEDSKTSVLIKLIGYPISLFFLMMTVAILLWDKDQRKVL